MYEGNNTFRCRWPSSMAQPFMNKSALPLKRFWYLPSHLQWRRRCPHWWGSDVIVSPSFNWRWRRSLAGCVESLSHTPFIQRRPNTAVDR